MSVVPAIDLLNGKCVRLSQGDFDKKTIYSDDPLSVARKFEDAGFSRLHLVDLDGAKSGAPHHYEVLKTLVQGTGLKIDYSGGLRSEKNIGDALEHGASYVVVGSMAVRNPDAVMRVLKEYGEKIILGADVREGLIAINGWREQTTLSITQFIGEFVQNGLERVMITDVNRDGMLGGPNMILYKEIMAEFPKLKVIASGGVSSRKDAEYLLSIGIAEVIVGKAFYEGIW